MIHVSLREMIYWSVDVFIWYFLYSSVTVNKSQMEIPAEREQDFVWRVEQRNKKTFLKFDAGINRENVEY